MNVVELAAMLMRLLLILTVPWLLSACVTHYSTEPQESEVLAADRLSDTTKYSLETLKKRMSACAIQYAIAAKKNDDLHVEFKADKQRVSYHSATPDLTDYMNICAGEFYIGNDRDKGIISISSKGV